MKNVAGVVLFVCLFAVIGCQSTLDQQATRQNDTNVQRISRENDVDNEDKLERGEITETTKDIRGERNHKARRLARSMARDAGNDDLPIIPREIEDEPEWADPNEDPDSE